MTRPYVKELSETELSPSDLIRMGMNTYYWDKVTRVLTMTKESPDSYWNWAHPKKYERKLSGKEVWEKLNGPVPEGYCIYRTDGDPDNNDPSNLECIPKKDIVKRNLQRRDEQYE
jgi:hypothetical protein